MMLSKSRKSAIIIAAITLFATLASALVWMSVSWWLQGELVNSLETIQWSWALCLGSPVILFVVVVLPGAFIIYGYDEAYFGVHGAVRWALFGILWIVSVLSTRTLLPDFESGETIGGYVLQRMVNAVVGLICALIAFRVAFIGRRPAKDIEEDQTNLFS